MRLVRRERDELVNWKCNDEKWQRWALDNPVGLLLQYQAINISL